MTRDEEGMEDALERARATGGADTYGVLASLEDDEPDVEVSDTTATSPATTRAEVSADIGEPVKAPPVQTSVPSPDLRSQRLAAVREAARLAAEPVSAGPSDSDIAAAQGRDREQRGRDRFTEAIQAWLLRRPARFTPTNETGDMLTRRQLAENSALKQRGQQLTAQQMLVKALTDPKGKGAPELTPYQVELLKRRDAEDDYRRTKDAKKAEADAAALAAGRKSWAPVLKEMGIDPETATQKDIDRAMQLKHAKATEGLARAQFGEQKQEHIDKQTQELTKALGDPTVFDAQYNRVQELIALNGGAVPGAGKLEALKQDSVLSPLLSGMSSDQAVEGRKLIKQLANNYVHAITGAGVSNLERSQLQSASVNVDSSDDRQIVLGLKTLKDMYDAKVKSAKAGFRPEAVERVESAQPPRPTTPISTKNPGDWVQLRRKNGDTIKATRADAEAFLGAHPGEAALEELK